MTFSHSDVLVIPFPFVDSPKSKLRPVVVLTAEKFNVSNGHCVAAMITTASHSQWLGDIEILDLKDAGLKHRSVIRMKLFTLDVRIGARKIGQLSSTDSQALLEGLNKYVLCGRFPFP